MSEKMEPFYFMNEGEKVDPFYKINEGNKHEIIITQNDRQYVRGDQICYEYKGITIFADIEDAIIVNTAMSTISIKKFKTLSPPEEREYLILLSENSDEEEENRFQGIIGRQETFDYLVSMIDSIDIHKSIILAETTCLRNAISVYKFMNRCITDGLIQNNSGFDIEDFNYDNEESEE